MGWLHWHCSIIYFVNSLAFGKINLSVLLTMGFTQAGTPHQDFKTQLLHKLTSWLLEPAWFLIIPLLTVGVTKQLFYTFIYYQCREELIKRLFWRSSIRQMFDCGVLSPFPVKLQIILSWLQCLQMLSMGSVMNL